MTLPQLGGSDGTQSVRTRKRRRWVLYGALAIGVVLLAVTKLTCGTGYQVRAMYWNNRAVEERSRGNLDRAIALYRLAIEIDPRLARAWTGLGILLQDRDDLELAIETYMKAASLHPHDVRPWVGWGHILEMKDDLTAAADVYRSAVAANPGSDEIWNKWGIVLQRQGQIADAAEEYQKAVALDPHNAGYRSNLETALAILSKK